MDILQFFGTNVAQSSLFSLNRETKQFLARRRVSPLSLSLSEEECDA
jgi:hypothetical protein